ncbi:MAG: hypothetical protein IKW85_09550 [Muribaculaceae bacterium]|nr:hypothetical protein [Muribaculaceae bacterium]
MLSYQKAEVIYEMTCYFCHNYLDGKDRTIDQMLQVARSGKQNIVKGCAASAPISVVEALSTRCPPSTPFHFFHPVHMHTAFPPQQ